LLYFFGNYTLDTDRRELRHPDLVAVEPQVFDILEYLVRHHDRVVSRDDLIASVWGGRIVSESALSTRINAVRSAIGDDGESQRLIRTLPRKGFRFVGEVRQVDEKGQPRAPRAAASPSSATATVAPRVEAERRHLTVVSCDFVGLRDLATRLDPEELRTVIGACHACCYMAAVRWDGSVARFADDGATIHFSYPQAHEDDAERAVRAGLDLIARIKRLETGQSIALATRIGIATGLVILGELSGASGNGTAHERAAFGQAPALAAALRSVTEPNTVLIAASTHGLLGGLFEYQAVGPLALDGFPSAVPAWLITSANLAESRFDALHKTRLTPFVGREEELALLLRRWRQATAGEGQVVLISGEPGIGKSRLVARFAECITEQARYTRLLYQCSPYYCDTPLYPFTAQLERYAVIASDDPPTLRLDKLEAVVAIRGPSRQSAISLLAALLAIPTGDRYPPNTLTPMQQRRQTLAVLLDQLEALAQRQPVLLVFEDVHWADPTSIELLDLMVERIRRLAVLTLITFRPEFKPSWVGLANVSALTLQRLGRRDVQAIVGGVAEGRTLPSEVVEQIISKADGVPLFVEELTKAILESGLLTKDESSYQLSGPLPVLAIPLTLQDSLMARLDRLGPAKEIAQIGSAIGREFSYDLLRAVAQIDDTALRDALARLEVAELASSRGRPANAAYVFKHALVQDAAYGTLLRETRRQLHGRIAKALEDYFPSTVETQPELIAHHLAKAELGEKAIRYWLKAGATAVSRSANLEAISHLHNGLQRLNTVLFDDKRAQLELELQLTLGQAFIAARGYTAGETTAAFARAEELGERIGDAGQRYSALYGIFVGRLIGGHIEAASETIARLRQLAASDEDDAYRCLAHRLHGSLLFFRGDLPIARENLQKAVALYGPSQQKKLAFHFGPDTGSAAQIFLAMTEWLRGRPESALRMAQSAIANARRLENALTLGQVQALAAQLHYMSQDYEGMLQLSREGSDNCERAGILYFGSICRLHQIWSQAWRSNPADYIEEFRHSLATYEEMRCGLQLGLFHSMLAQLLLAAGHPAEAAKEAETALAKITVDGEGWWAPEIHRTLGDVLLALPNHEAEAESCYVRAIAEARHTGGLMLEIRAATSLARMMVKRGDEAEARRTLAPIFAQFSEGFDSSDLRAAQAVFAENHAAEP
jgi:DNA-binding winged helix-turn-helix (wHTH) protein/tetratricopeptide (TPR) repeat protein